jgi:ferric-dicitrate binding protein FerR (iron transport regulator)
MRERTSIRSFLGGLRAHAPEALAAARELPALLRRLASSESAAAPAAAEAQVESLRAELRLMRRRSDAVTLGALLAMGGIVWLALALQHAWVGWALLAAATAKLVYGLWR